MWITSLATRAQIVVQWQRYLTCRGFQQRPFFAFSDDCSPTWKCFVELRSTGCSTCSGHWSAKICMVVICSFRIGAPTTAASKGQYYQDISGSWKVPSTSSMFESQGANWLDMPVDWLPYNSAYYSILGSVIILLMLSHSLSQACMVLSLWLLALSSLERVGEGPIIYTGLTPSGDW